MKWYNATLYEPLQVGEDSVGNPIMKDVPRESPIMVRSSPYVHALHRVDGNSFHETERMFLTNARPSLLEGVSAIEVKGSIYEIVSVNHDSMPLIITAKRAKDGV